MMMILGGKKYITLLVFCVNQPTQEFPFFLPCQEKKKTGETMSLEEAIDDSENLTDFLLDFDED